MTRALGADAPIFCIGFLFTSSNAGRERCPAFGGSAALPGSLGFAALAAARAQLAFGRLRRWLRLRACGLLVAARTSSIPSWPGVDRVASGGSRDGKSRNTSQPVTPAKDRSATSGPQARTRAAAYAAKPSEPDGSRPAPEAKTKKLTILRTNPHTKISGGEPGPLRHLAIQITWPVRRLNYGARGVRCWRYCCDWPRRYRQNPPSARSLKMRNHRPRRQGIRKRVHRARG